MHCLYQYIVALFLLCHVLYTSKISLITEYEMQFHDPKAHFQVIKPGHYTSQLIIYLDF